MTTILPGMREGAPTRRNKGQPIGLPRALAIAFAIEALAIAGLMSVRHTPPAPPHDEPIVMRALTPVKPIEPPKPPEPVKPPPPAVRQIVRTPPKVVHESAPMKLDAPKPVPAQAAAPAQVSVPQDVGAQHQAQGPADAKPTPPAPPSPPTLAIRHGVQRIGGSYPAYPEQARRRGIGGKVVAHLVVHPDGSVGEVTIVSSQPRGVFDEEVIRSLKGWRFAPDPTGFIGEVEISFAVPDSDDDN
ncbi:energy transducer TonB [Paraburkholderia sp.]|uniref:energy transducer TonB n=1 Tax=Paraburkholderia sp. TaxID=1926495 RepID=UPI002387ED3D|nr:energy transducer TonB [Paraburkholderia sp.]MDE1181869.1 energy transducer TonB [Paraburkholderia sp.]